MHEGTNHGEPEKTPSKTEQSILVPIDKHLVQTRSMTRMSVWKRNFQLCYLRLLYDPGEN